MQDSAYAWAYNVEKGEKTRIIGPNCPGIITPGESLVGITPNNITDKGPIGLVSKSGTLTYQMMYELRDLGFSTAIGIGGDPVIGTTHIDAIEAFEKDPETKIIVMIGEIGGDAEEKAAAYIQANVSKPVVGYVAGFTAPEGKTMGHAGAIVSDGAGTADGKKAALEAAGVKVGKTPSETAKLARELLEGPVVPRTFFPLAGKLDGVLERHQSADEADDGRRDVDDRRQPADVDGGGHPARQERDGRRADTPMNTVRLGWSRSAMPTEYPMVGVLPK